MHSRNDQDRRVRQALSIGFGTLWLLDGLLQFLPQQGSNTLAMLAMGGWGQPLWLLNAVDGVINVIYLHGWASVFSLVLGIGQGVIGLLILLGPDRRWGRIGLYASIPAALAIWFVGEWLGGVAGFWSGGITFLNGGPGAAFLYLLGAWILLPEGRLFGDALQSRLRHVVSGLWLLGALLQSVPRLWSGTSLSQVFAESQVLTRQGFWTRPIVPVVHWTAQAPALWNAAFVAAMLVLGLALLLRKDSWPLYVFAGLWILFIWWLGENFGGLPGLATTDVNSGPAWAVLLLPLALEHFGRSRVGLDPGTGLRRSG